MPRPLQLDALSENAHDVIKSLGFSPSALNRLLGWGFTRTKLSMVLHGTNTDARKIAPVRESLTRFLLDKNTPQSVVDSIVLPSWRNE